MIFAYADILPLVWNVSIKVGCGREHAGGGRSVFFFLLLRWWLTVSGFVK